MSISSDQVVKRAQRLAPVVVGSTVLWVDDHAEYNRLERRLLRQLGIFVEAVSSNREAIRVLGDTDETISVVVSDINRGTDSHGLALLQDVANLSQSPPVIFYVADLDIDRGVPPGAFGITNRPDELLNLVMDALERMPERREP